MAAFAYDSLHIDALSILAVNLDYGTGLTRVFTNEFERKGGQILATEYYDRGATDFRSSLSKLIQLHPQAIYLPGYYSEIGLAIRQAKELGYQGKLLSCVGFDDPKVLEIGGTAVEGVIFSRPLYDPNSSDSLVKDFVESFRKAYGTSPGIYAAHAFDAARLTIAALDGANARTADSIVAVFKATKDFPGVTGPISFDQHGDVTKPTQFMIVRNSEFVPYGRIR